MPECGKRVDIPDYRNKCYRHKEDHNFVPTHVMIPMSQDRWEQIFGRKERLRDVKKETKVKEVDFPNVGLWDKEWTIKATGYKMTRRQLERYCKKNSKRWEN